jgi:hypothetical protein
MKTIIKIVVGFVLTSTIHLSFGQAVFQTIDLAVTNPAAVVAAMDKFAASPTGRSASSSVTLYSYVANGENEATHVVNVVHSSPAEMDANMEKTQGSQDAAALALELNQAARIVNTRVGQILLSGGSAENITSENPAVMIYLMSVSDPAAYAREFSSFLSQNAGIGQTFLSSSLADGDDPATHIVFNAGNSLGELIMNQPQSQDGWDAYVSRVGGLRTIEGTAMLRTVKSWASQ